MQGVHNPGRLQVLGQEQVDAMHDASLRLLERTGVRFDSPDALSRLRTAGALPHPTRKNVLTFPRSVVDDAIREIPFYGTYCARDPKNDVTFDGEHSFAHALGGNPAILDLETGRSRSSTLHDVEQATRLQDALANCHTASNLVVATDVPAPLLVVRTMEAMIKNTSKCVPGYALRVPEVDVLAEMGACVAGGSEAFRKRPILTLYGSPSSPLTYDAHVCDVVFRAVEHGIPVDIVPCPIGGGTAPLSLAGGLTQQNAELLAGVMLLQTVDPKLPSQYSGRLSFLDLRSGKNLWGLPELALASAATVQIAHRYHMTADVYGVTTDANQWDLQIGLERMMAALPPALAGADNLSGMGGAWENAASLEMMVIDDEVYADIFRIVRGIEVDEDRLALHVLDAVGPMGNFLAQRHTMKYLRQGEMRNSPLWDKRTLERATSEGIRPIQDVAREKVRKLLQEHEPTPLDRDIERDLARVVREGSKDLLEAA
ncbi:MAG TPA: trimethylamine methyltransferase family protein [Thermoplasmata archaeon]|nr:trimethylamine methyltransferase family protein [Thermoplasmata archaeon]